MENSAAETQSNQACELLTSREYLRAETKNHMTNNILADTSLDGQCALSRVKNRRFQKWVEDNLPDWKLTKRIKNRFPDEETPDFFAYARERLRAH